jgi:hypothetical protein
VLNDNNSAALDPDGDGVACESLPGSSGTQSQQANTASTDLTDQEETYFDELQDQVESYGDTSEEFANLFGQAGEDPTLFVDESWLIQVAGELVSWQTIAADAQTLDPSSRQQPIHDIWLEINRMNLLVVDDISYGIDNLDPDAINRSTARILYITLLIDDITDVTVEFIENPNAPIEPEQVIGPVPDCEPFSDYDQAQVYYGAHPEEQPVIDPDFDGLACEVFFGRG